MVVLMGILHDCYIKLPKVRARQSCNTHSCSKFAISFVLAWLRNVTNQSQSTQTRLITLYKTIHGFVLWFLFIITFFCIVIVALVGFKLVIQKANV